jgi:tRNA threonylcarbamoyladenosine biosynthesis protein TsaB
MLILALETATASCTVAVVQDDRLLAELTLHVPRAHSTRLMPLVAQAVAESGVERRDLDAIAAGIGPGSFTGLRIGLATAKSLAYALGKPAVGVPTLLATAYGTGAQTGLVVPLLDARRGEVFAAAYVPGDRSPSTWAEVMPPSALPLAELAERIRALRTGLRHTWQPVLLCGDAAAGRAPLFGETACEAPAGVALPRGWAVAAIARERLSRAMPEGAGAAFPPDALAPLYLRRSAAEEKHG